MDLPGLSYAAANEIVQAAIKKAAALESPIYKKPTKMHIHVIGVEGTLLAASQADNAWPGSDDIATKKARTALLFKLPTRTIGDLSRPEQSAKGPLYRIEHSNGGLISFPGGLPIMDAAGNCVGAIGVSGDTVERDEEVAKAGVDAFNALIKK
ncbi:MAG TPA: heme-binding protein [Planctomycetota bacterium]|nr:heme-binding protein [Planctomycetota bacterium]